MMHELWAAVHHEAEWAWQWMVMEIEDYGEALWSFDEALANTLSPAAGSLRLLGYQRGQYLQALAYVSFAASGQGHIHAIYPFATHGPVLPVEIGGSVQREPEAFGTYVVAAYDLTLVSFWNPFAPFSRRLQFNDRTEVTLAALASRMLPPDSVGPGLRADSLQLGRAVVCGRIEESRRCKLSMHSFERLVLSFPTPASTLRLPVYASWTLLDGAFPSVGDLWAAEVFVQGYEPSSPLASAVQTPSV